MSFETLVDGSGDFKGFGRFADGEFIEGYFMGFEASTHPKVTSTNLKFKMKDGREKSIGRNGKLAYLESDLEAAGKQLVVGAMTRLTRTGSYVAKGRTDPSPTYSIAQDLKDTIKVVDENKDKLEALREQANSK